MLSPISDKSQEQCSEPCSDNSRTPKVSPTALANSSSSSTATNTPATVDNAFCVGGASNNNYKERAKNDNDNSVMREALDVPWEVPKLRRRLQQNLNEGRTSNDQLRGSDSGISMASQVTKNSTI